MIIDYLVRGNLMQPQDPKSLIKYSYGQLRKEKEKNKPAPDIPDREEKKRLDVAMDIQDAWVSMTALMKNHSKFQWKKIKSRVKIKSLLAGDTVRTRKYKRQDFYDQATAAVLFDELVTCKYVDTEDHELLIIYSYGQLFSKEVDTAVPDDWINMSALMRTYGHQQGTCSWCRVKQTTTIQTLLNAANLSSKTKGNDEYYDLIAAQKLVKEMVGVDWLTVKDTTEMMNILKQRRIIQKKKRRRESGQQYRKEEKKKYVKKRRESGQDRKEENKETNKNITKSARKKEKKNEKIIMSQVSIFWIMHR